MKKVYWWALGGLAFVAGFANSKKQAAKTSYRPIQLKNKEHFFVIKEKPLALPAPGPGDEIINLPTAKPKNPRGPTRPPPQLPGQNEASTAAIDATLAAVKQVIDEANAKERTKAAQKKALAPIVLVPNKSPSSWTLSFGSTAKLMTQKGFVTVEVLGIHGVKNQVLSYEGLIVRTTPEGKTFMGRRVEFTSRYIWGNPDGKTEARDDQDWQRTR